MENTSMKKSLMSVQTITLCAMFVAIGVVLSFIRIPLSTVTEITLTGLPIAAAAYLFGPGIGFVTGVLIDVCGFIAMPRGAFFPGFTISTGMIGLIYGLLLYRKWWKGNGRNTGFWQDRKKGLAVRVVLAHLIKTAAISLSLNCLWLSIFYGMDFAVVFLASLPKELINFPIEVILIYSMIRFLMRVWSVEGIQHHD